MKDIDTLELIIYKRTDEKWRVSTIDNPRDISIIFRLQFHDACLVFSMNMRDCESLSYVADRCCSAIYDYKHPVKHTKSVSQAIKPIKHSFTAYTCSQCGAVLKYNDKTGKFVCEHCGVEYLPEED